MLGALFFHLSCLAAGSRLPSPSLMPVTLLLKRPHRAGHERKQERVDKINTNFFKGLTLCFVDGHRVCQPKRKLVSLKHKWEVDVTRCQLDPGNEYWNIKTQMPQ